MQKLPEASDRKKGDTCAKKRTVPTKEGIFFSFTSDQLSDNILLTAGGRHAFVFRRRIG